MLDQDKNLSVPIASTMGEANRFATTATRFMLSIPTSRLIFASAVSIGIVTLLTFAGMFINKDSLWIHRSEFMLSFFASAVESILFFSVVGVVTSLAAASDPRRAAYESKIRYLFPSVSVSTGALSYAANEIERLGCIAQHIKRTIKVIKVRDEDENFRLYVTTRYVFLNIFDSRSVRANLGPSISPDSTAPDGTLLGEVIELSVVPFIGLSEHHVDQPETIPASGYEKEVWVDIPPGKNVEVIARHWVWQNDGEDVFFSPKRYTEKFESNIENGTNALIKVEYGLSTKGPITVEPNQVLTVIQTDRLSPGVYQRFWICTAGRNPSANSTLAVI